MDEFELLDLGMLTQFEFMLTPPPASPTRSLPVLETNDDLGFVFAFSFNFS